MKKTFRGSGVMILESYEIYIVIGIIASIVCRCVLTGGTQIFAIIMWAVAFYLAARRSVMFFDLVVIESEVIRVATLFRDKVIAFDNISDILVEEKTIKLKTKDKKQTCIFLKQLSAKSAKGLISDLEDIKKKLSS